MKLFMVTFKNDVITYYNEKRLYSFFKNNVLFLLRFFLFFLFLCVFSFVIISLNFTIYLHVT